MQEKLRSSTLSCSHWPASNIHYYFSSNTLCMCVSSAELHFSLVSCGLVEWQWVSPRQCQTQPKLVTLLCLQILLPSHGNMNRSVHAESQGVRWSPMNIKKGGIYVVWPDSLFAPVKQCWFPDVPPYLHLHVWNPKWALWLSNSVYTQDSWAKAAGSCGSTKWKTWCQLEIGSYPSSSKCFRITCPLITL